MPALPRAVKQVASAISARERELLPVASELRCELLRAVGVEESSVLWPDGELVSPLPHPSLRGAPLAARHV